MTAPAPTPLRPLADEWLAEGDRRFDRQDVDWWGTRLRLVAASSARYPQPDAGSDGARPVIARPASARGDVWGEFWALAHRLDELLEITTDPLAELTTEHLEVGSLHSLIGLLVAEGVDPVSDDFTRRAEVLAEWCGWCTEHGVLRTNPLSDLLSEVADTARELGRTVKTGHGGPALDSSYDVAVALSGGGHRATLYGLGAYLAVQQVQPVADVSSVSGGTVTNAFLAVRFYGDPELFGYEPNSGGVIQDAVVQAASYGRDHFEGYGRSGDPALRAESWQRATERLFDIVVEQGVVTTPWLVAMAALVFVPPTAFVASALLGVLPPAVLTIALAAVWLSVILLRGVLVEWLMARRYFGTARRRLQLGSLADPVRRHVICCADLVSGEPFYGLSSGQVQWCGDRIEMSTLPLVALVRASAGFPGIPPRRIRLKRSDETRRQVAFLSDGGIQNNLATQAHDDELFPRAWVVLVADASAGLRSVRAWPFYVPGWAEIRALVRQTIIQNANTVTPRRLTYEEGVRREICWPRDARFKSRRLFVVSAIHDTPRAIADHLERAIEAAVPDDDDPWGERREKTLGRVRELRESQILDSLERLAFPRASHEAHDQVAFLATTLGRVPRDIARKVVARGFANTSTLLYLTGLIDELVWPDGWLANEVLRCSEAGDRQPSGPERADPGRPPSST